MHPTADEIRQVREASASQRAHPQTIALLASLLDSDNPKVVKLATQYDRGIITFEELEYKVREVLTSP